MQLPRRALSYLVWTSNNSRKLALFLILTLDHGLNDTWMIGAQIDKAMGDACLPQRLEEGE